ncbi:MAG: hypothetical protein GVY36_14100 [Verrucomicrobia bacterium]|jgi:hypothetical protein|nr:hypothetical protein [Verrucomicrobiota bacterium]
MAEPIIICGQQRSGTTALQSALAHVDGVRNLGEVFQFHGPLVENAAHNFYYYVNNVRGGWTALTSAEEAESELEKFLHYLETLVAGSHFVIDIKYNLWHHFSPGWFNIYGRPFMLEYFKKRGFPIIHVERKNLFRQFVSHEFASRARKWHYHEESSEIPKIPAFDLNIEELSEYFEMVDGNQALFRKRLKNYPKAVHLTYEDLFDGRALRPESERKLRRVLPGWILAEAESRFIKPAVDPVRWVKNGEAVIDAFRQTRFGVMVIDTLRPPLSKHQSP